MSVCSRFSKLVLSRSERVRCTAAVCIQPVRYRWKPPDPDAEILPSYSQRLAEWKSRHDYVPASDGINIGFPFLSSTNNQTKLDKIRQWTKSKLTKEKSARHRELKIDLDAMREEWSSESRPKHMSRIAKHYGIFRDMFDGAYFNPVIPMDVQYDYDEEFVTPVYYGNVVPAQETEVKPYIVYEDIENSLWTLVMSSPDGNLEENNREVLHWMVGNIPSNSVEQGDTLCHYLQPFPVKGAGFLRYVFVLYKHSKPLDLNRYRIPSDCLSLRDRSFSTLDFYHSFEDELTPAGLAFFQSQWDPSVRSTFHNVLDMPEPKFEFIHPPEYFPEQEEFPHKKAFNMYLDRYRDVKDLQEEVLKYKLRNVDPLLAPGLQSKDINVDRLTPDTPSWLRCKIQHMRLGKFHWKAAHQEPKE